MEEYIAKMETVKLEVQQNGQALNDILTYISSNTGYTMESQIKGDGVIFEIFHKEVLICKIESCEHTLYVEFKELLTNQEVWTLLYSHCIFLYMKSIYLKIQYTQVAVYNKTNLEMERNSEYKAEADRSIGIEISITEDTLEHAMKWLQFGIDETIKREVKMSNSFVANLNYLEESVKTIFKTKEHAKRYEGA